jgi:hypothetical protein
MALRSVKEQRIADDLLVDLARHPGFQVLKERMLAHQQREMESLGTFLLRSPDQLDPLALERKRGFYAGQRWFLRAVENELALFNRQPEEPTE